MWNQMGMLVPTKRAAITPTAQAFKKPKVGGFNVGAGAMQHMAGAMAAAASPGQGAHRGEVRFATPDAVQQALMLNGTEFLGTTIGVELDIKSKDGTKVIITGLQPHHGWQDLKDHFGMCGQVVFTNVKEAADTPCMGQVRFPTPEMAKRAMLLNGSTCGGYQIEVKMHPGSKDGTKLQISNLPPGLEWQELKDHFSQNGLQPVFVETSGDEAAATAEVRYQDATHAAAAVQMLNTSLLGGAQIGVEMDPNTKDQTKLRISGVPPGIDWQELKDHFNQVGQVAFVEVHRGNKLPKAGGAGGHKSAAGFANAFGMGGGGMAGMVPVGQMLPNGMILLPTGAIVTPDQMGLMAGAMGGGMAGMMGGMAGKKGGKGAMGAKISPVGLAGGAGPTGEVRFAMKLHADLAVQMLNNSELMGGTLQVALDSSSADGTKVYVTGLVPGTGWQDLKDHCAQVGQVAFCNVK